MSGLWYDVWYHHIVELSIAQAAYPFQTTLREQGASCLAVLRVQQSRCELLVSSTKNLCIQLDFAPI